MKKLIRSILFLLFIFLIIMILVITKNTTFIDNYIYRAVRMLKSEFFDNYFLIITRLGNPKVVLLVLLLLFFMLTKKEAIVCSLLALDSTIDNLIIKYIVRRDRPNILRLIEISGYSFPSGHSMIAVTLYGSILYLLLKKITNKYLKILVFSIFSLLILSIGISRIYIGVHYASDVICGFILGAIELLILRYIYNCYLGGEVKCTNC